MAGLFPFFGDTAIETNSTEELPLYKEVAWDFVNNIPLLKNGEYQIVTGNEGIKTWIYKAMKTERFRYRIYSWDFGSEMENLIGQSYTANLTKAECIRYIEECISINPYIQMILQTDVSFKEGNLLVYCKLRTVYGETELEVMV